MSNLDTIISNSIARGLSAMANAGCVSTKHAEDALMMIAQAQPSRLLDNEVVMIRGVPVANWRDGLPSRKAKTKVKGGCAYCRSKNSFSKGHCNNCGASEE